MFSADQVARTYLKEGHCERKYLDGVLHELESFLQKQPSASDVEIHIVGQLDPLPRDCHPAKSIIFSLSEEKRLIPRYFPKVLLVFKQHAPYLRLTRFGLIGFRPANVFPLPLGYDSHVPYHAPKPVGERPIDVFFSGSNWKSRHAFFRAAERLKAASPWKVEVTATDSFHSGLSPEEYGRKLGNTKIALSPKGFVSTESFRMYEALRAGCVLVTVRQPKSWYRTGWPAVEVRRWSSLKSVVDGLLKDEAELSRRQQESIRWWNEKCSERAVAEVIGRTALTYRRRPGLLAVQHAASAVINFILAVENRVVATGKSLVRRR